jgi:hypothetical protein
MVCEVMGCDDHLWGGWFKYRACKKKTFFCGTRSCVEEIPEKDMSGEEAGKA